MVFLALGVIFTSVLRVILYNRLAGCFEKITTGAPGGTPNSDLKTSELMSSLLNRRKGLWLAVDTVKRE
ncbi:hypothetical protein PC116_g31048 [Phytophthora cactorum]|nr:hypothetical protein PC116_g31048 [Phytophthora cactorum]